MANNLPSPRLARARDMKIMVTSVANELVREKADALLQGKGNRDMFTLLGVLATLVLPITDHHVTIS